MSIWDQYWLWPRYVEGGALINTEGPMLEILGTPAALDFSAKDFSTVWFIQVTNTGGFNSNNNKLRPLFNQGNGGNTNNSYADYAYAQLVGISAFASKSEDASNSTQASYSAPPYYQYSPEGSFQQRNAVLVMAHEYLGAGAVNECTLRFKDEHNLETRLRTSQRHARFNSGYKNKIGMYHKLGELQYYQGRLYGMIIIPNYLVTEQDTEDYFNEVIDPETYQSPSCFINFNKIVPASGGIITSDVGAIDWTVYGTVLQPILMGRGVPTDLEKVYAEKMIRSLMPKGGLW